MARYNRALLFFFLRSHPMSTLSLTHITLPLSPFHQLHIHQLLQSEARLGDEAGRISYAGFRFLSAMLAVPIEHVAVSFLVCDSDGNGAASPPPRCLGKACSLLTLLGALRCDV